MPNIYVLFCQSTSNKNVKYQTNKIVINIFRGTKMISNKKKYKKVLISFLIANLILIVIGINYLSIYTENTMFINEPYFNRPKTSYIHDLTGQVIYIDDADPNYNWSKTAAENIWCSGLGTSVNPYVIDSVLIDGLAGYNTLVTIKNSNASFTITNSKFFNTHNRNYYAIYLENVTNGNIGPFNNCSLSYGIRLHESSDNFISNNDLRDIPYGIVLEEFSNKNTIKYNIIQDASYSGISIYQDCVNNSIEENTIFSSPSSNPYSYGDRGIYLGGTYVNVTKNTIYNIFDEGIDISSDSDHVYIAHNSISNTGVGIWSYYSHELTIFNNTISDISAKYTYSYGIQLEDCGSVKLIENIIENTNYGAIFVETSIDIDIIDNHIDKCNGSGIYLADSVNFNISLNGVSNVMGFGINLINSEIGEASDNLIYGSGYNIDGDPSEMSNLDMDTSNMVNDKPLYFYEGANNLDNNDILNAGQIILYSCIGTTFSHLTLRSCSIGAAFYYCSILDLTDLHSTLNNVFGIKLSNTNHSTIVGSNISRNAIGISHEQCNDLVVDDCLIDNNSGNGIDGIGIDIEISYSTITDNGGNGIYAQQSSNCKIKDNDILNNTDNGIFISWSSLFNISLNNLNHNAISGVEIEYSNSCLVLKNIASNNGDYGIYLSSSRYCKVIDNTCDRNTHPTEFGDLHSSGIYIAGDYNYYIPGDNIYYTYNSYGHLVKGNTLTHNRESLKIEYSANDTIIDNTMTSQVDLFRSVLLNFSFNSMNIGFIPIGLVDDIYLQECFNFTVSYNILQGTGFRLLDSNYSIFISNQLKDCSIGFDLEDSSFNKIINNSITGAGQCFREHGNCIGNQFINNICQQGIILPFREIGALIGGVAVAVVTGIMFVKRRKYLRT